MLWKKRTRVVALIGPSPPGGVERAGVGWSLVVYLAAMRRPDGTVAEGDIRCEMPQSRTSMQRLMKKLAAYDVVELQIADDSDPSRLQLKNIRKAGQPDPALTAIAERLQVPVVLQHPVLGELSYDRRYGSYAVDLTWLGTSVHLDIEATDTDAASPGLQHAETLYVARQSWTVRAAEFAAERLLSLKNDNWLGENEAAVSRDEFIARLALESAWVGEQGDFSLVFADGDLFWGHWIDVSGSLEEGLTRADLGG